jgi:hypothetical protein
MWMTQRTSSFLSNAFWSFVLDMPSKDVGPRFKQFAENLRNYIAAAAVLKVGHDLFNSSLDQKLGWQVLFVGIGLFILGSAVFAFCELQLWGLLLWAWSYKFGNPMVRMAEENRKWKDFLRDFIGIQFFIDIPAFFLWAMFVFVRQNVVGVKFGP